MRNNRKTIIMATVLLIVALLVTVYPVISNYLAEKNKSEICTEYFNAIGGLDNSAIDAARHKAEEYNAMLANGVSQTFSDEQINEAADDYNELLNLTGNGIMAYIEIPKLKIYLPVAHGTEAATLENAVGHVIGSSLPIGGNGTHAVLSGHSGISNVNYSAQLNTILQIMGYEEPERRRSSEVKKEPATPREKSYPERRSGSTASRNEEKPSVRDTLERLKTVADKALPRSERGKDKTR